MATHRSRKHRNRQRRFGRRAVIIAVPLAVSAVLASAYTVVPRLTTAPTPGSEVAQLATQALTADPVRDPQQPLAAPVSATAATLPGHGHIGPATDYRGSVDHIPAAALAAYQRAEIIMGMAASGCRLEWTVLAGVAAVESNHGRAGSNRITDEGVSWPGVFGEPLNGKGGRARRPDTDAGHVDDNSRWDAPTGPMGLLPSTWSAVAVDSDGDGNQNLQDVDDAALGVAVFLCHDDRDLSVRAELRGALMALNPRPGYARLVMSLARSYGNDTATQALPPAVVETLPLLPVGPLPSPSVPLDTTDIEEPDGSPNNEDEALAQDPSAPAQPDPSPTPPPSGATPPAAGPPAPEAGPPESTSPASPTPVDSPPASESPTPVSPAPEEPPAASEPPSEESCVAAAEPGGAEGPSPAPPSCDPAGADGQAPVDPAP